MKKLITDESAFLGMVTAGISHDLSNVLAVIRETAGLLSDMVEMAGPGGMDPGFRERVRGGLAAVEKQVTRGGELTSALNRFAHLPDRRPTSVSLDLFLKDFALLFARYLRLKGGSITLSEGNPCLWEVCPVRLEMVLFACLESLVDLFPEDRHLLMVLEKRGTSCLILLSCRPFCQGEEASDALQKINTLAQPSGITVEAVGSGFQIALSGSAR